MTRDPEHRAAPALAPAPTRAANLLGRGELAVGAPDDRFEHEADRVADQVMRAPAAAAPPVSIASSAPVGTAQRACATCSQEDEKLRGKPIASSLRVSPEAADGIAATRGAGAPLPAAARAFFEPRFGHDFGGVRVHHDAGAQSIAGELRARAFTVGRDVYFGAGQYSPSTDGGRHLLAHELAHVVQQRGSAPSGDHRSLEREAHGEGARAAGGARADVRGSAPAGTVQGFEAEEHRKIGDQASREGTHRRYIKLGKKGYTLSFGEMNALAGDVFGSLGVMEQLADKPGKGPDSWEALDYARYILVKKRVAADSETFDEAVDAFLGEKAADKAHRYDPKSYSPETRKFVDSSYYNLAAKNRSHFVTPNDKDAGKAPRERPQSAGSEFRFYHEWALQRAVSAGQTRDPLDGALAAEAFADHFLQDMHSAGHLRTQREDIETRWNSFPPGPKLNDKLKAYLEGRIFDWVHHNKVVAQIPIFSPPVAWTVARSKIRKSVEAAFAGKPTLTMGALVALAVHDYDNVVGVHVRVDGQSHQIFGDKSLDKGDTLVLAKRAVAAAIAEVKRAYEFGKKGAKFEDVRAELLAAGGGQYAPERMVPTLDPAYVNVERQAAWQSGSTLEDLLKDPKMVKGLEELVRGHAEDIAKLAESMEDADAKKALMQIVQVLLKNPIGELRAIYHWKT